MKFWKIVGAYLTGWVIAQSFYNRVVRHYKETAWEDEKQDIAERTTDAIAEWFANGIVEDGKVPPTHMMAGARRVR